MISFRHHVVSLVAVLAALAAGVALGGGPLSDLGRTASPELRAENDELRAQLSAADGAGDVAQQVLGANAQRVVAGALTDLRVAVVTLPGASDKVSAGLSETVRQAGGTVVATYALSAKAYAPADKSLVDTLGSQLAEGIETVPAEATTYERLGGILAAVAVGADERTTSLTSSLTSAKLLTVSEEAAPADLAVVVAGEKASDLEVEALADLLGGLDAGVDGSVVAATTASAESGLLAGLREDSDWVGVASSVDAAQTEAGRVNVVLALAADAAGGQGHYGARGADGATPAR